MFQRLIGVICLLTVLIGCAGPNQAGGSAQNGAAATPKPRPTPTPKPKRSAYHKLGETIEVRGVSYMFSNAERKTSVDKYAAKDGEVFYTVMLTIKYVADRSGMDYRYSDHWISR